MIIININGPINSGKTTIAKILAKKLRNSLFVEIDDLLNDAEQTQLKLGFFDGISLRLDRFDKILDEAISNQKLDYIIFAFPMDKGNYTRWKNIINNRAVFKAVTLSPSIEKCLTDRGTRHLTNWEKDRIKIMYQENYHRPDETNLIIDNSNQTPEETTANILNYLNL